MELSIIIPVLDDAECLEICLKQLFSLPSEVEIIVVDGGSSDHSVQVAKKHGAQILKTPASRSKQMNAGADLASGKWLLFLHADSSLSIDAICSIYTNKSGSFDVGCFKRRFFPTHKLLDWTCKLANWRAARFGLAFGDQGIFLQRRLFDSLGGYRNMKHFEDMDLTRRAARFGQWQLLPHILETSSRRFGKSTGSILWRILSDFCLTTAWLLKIIR